jgi:hypothetical protein
MKSFIVFSTIAAAAGQSSKLNFEVSGESSSIGVEAVALDNLELTCGSGESASTSNLCGVATTKSDVAALSGRLDALEITTGHLLRAAGFADSNAIAAHHDLQDSVKCSFEGSEYAIGAIVQMHGCPIGCGIPHPCMQKSYGGFTAAEKDACMGATGGNKVEDIKTGAIYEFVRDTSCNSFTNWARSGEGAYSRTDPGKKITDVIQTVVAHGASYPKGMIDTDRDRYAICHANSAQSGSTAYDLLEPAAGSPTQAFDVCRDFRLGGDNVHNHPTTCIDNNAVRQTAAGQGFKMSAGRKCSGPALVHEKTNSVYGAFQMYENKGPMANAKHATNQQYFNPSLDTLVTGFQAAKDACLGSTKCGGISKAHGSLMDQYWVNIGSESTYAADGYDKRLGHWSHDFSISTGYDVWVRQGFTTSDLLAMCEETATCECINIHLSQTSTGAVPNQQYNWASSWSMHSGTGTAGGTAVNSDSSAGEYAIAKTAEAATLPQIGGGGKVTGTCTLSGDQTSATFVTPGGTCVSNCESAW